MTEIKTDIKAAIASLTDANQLIRLAKNEQVIRDSFTSHLRQIFPEVPGWVVRHIQGSEAAVKLIKTSGISSGFVDNLLDLTAIEYERDLTIASKYAEGYNQVKDYCSSLLNDGHDPELVIGILSDTVRWFAYKVDLSNLGEGPYHRNNIVLIEIDQIDCSSAGPLEANNLIRFIIRFMGRQGARPFSADAIAKDLGFESQFSEAHISSLEAMITHAFSEKPDYAALIKDLWTSFVSYLREDGKAEGFDMKTYVDEYYISLLAKLICANFLEQKSLSSTDKELQEIIDGTFFENKGLHNFVEYDYFGWLNSGQQLETVKQVARALQSDLVAYDFTKVPAEDLFGNMMAQLANRSQRILLGQEWTPGWLAEQIVENVISKIPTNTPLRLIDMCCGSGSMIVHSVKMAIERIKAMIPLPSPTQCVAHLTQAITGFDIDPLAVLLSKINWVLAAKEFIEPLGSHQISIPIYHADSLFAISPLSKNLQFTENEQYKIQIAEHEILLPVFLIKPENQRLFDLMIESAYHEVLDAETLPTLNLSELETDKFIRSSMSDLGLTFEPEEIRLATSFYYNLVISIDKLNRDGRNGIWASILKNSFRPGLVFGQFNGLVSNPPWLALSKIAENPYKVILKTMAQQFNIKPAGSSHLHIELATIFLLHAIHSYLENDAIVGCVLPDTVLNGHHHNPFRTAEYVSAAKPVNFTIDEIWKVEEQTFKNNAIVVFGKKHYDPKAVVTQIPGGHVNSAKKRMHTQFYNNTQGKRTAWAEIQLAESGGFYIPAKFREGADIMPRNLLFYDIIPVNTDQVKIQSIDPLTSANGYIVKNAKKHTSFVISSRVWSSDFVFDVITSNLLVPFDLGPVQHVLLPLKKDVSNVWRALDQREINSKGTIERNTFNEIFGVANPAKPTVEGLFDLINMRGKLTQQVITTNGFLVMTGAGGSNVCACYKPTSDFDLTKLIIDQTIYFAQVSTEDEAIYLTGLLNSQAVGDVIKEFQSRGGFGERHIHKLPFGVTPPFDQNQSSHTDVVKYTKILLADFETAKMTDSELTKLSDPTKASMITRRKATLRVIRQLRSYDLYEEACRALYGL